MQLGAWVHDQRGDAALARQISAAAVAGLGAIRSYSLGYSRKVAPAVRAAGLRLLAGLWVDGPALAADWRSQVRLEQLEATVALDCELAGICVGNELREGGDEPHKKRFTPRLSEGLARLIDCYRDWLTQRGVSVTLTYAMEGLVFADTGGFRDHVRPLVAACDVVGLNHYPLSAAQWFTFGAFAESRRFLHDDATWQPSMGAWAGRLRAVLQELGAAGKPLILTETGFPSAVGYTLGPERNGRRPVRPTHDRAAFARRMTAFVALLAQIAADHPGALDTVYFYEWWDNHHHAKIWNVEQSPIHTCFGLCDEHGAAKIDISALVGATRTATS